MFFIIFSLLFLLTISISVADDIPNDIQMPGTQPGEVIDLTSKNICFSCHSGYNRTVEPAFNWLGSLMANAGRDPVFWAALAIAEQDFEGSGDLCLRCHSPSGWLGGRSNQTDGSALLERDSDGVSCDLCHRLTNPDNSEHIGIQNQPFIANQDGLGYYGSGMYVLINTTEKLGPYIDPATPHLFRQSEFHRSGDLCGTCHDVSNPLVGDLSHNKGAQTKLDVGKYNGTLNSEIESKAAFNNFPFQYGMIERTYSEWKASLFPKTLISDFQDLPSDLKKGILLSIFETSTKWDADGNYEDGTERYFSCQTCHMKPVTGEGSNLNSPERQDLPLHDLVGANYWIQDAIAYLDSIDKLRLGGGLSSTHLEAMDYSKKRTQNQLSESATLQIDGDTLRVINHAGHKLITGYPEGKRMWLNIKWYDEEENLLREDGAYGTITVSINGDLTQVDTILNINDPNTKIYEAHYAITQEWANQLLELGYSPGLALSFDRESREIDYTLGQLADQQPGTYSETFHFVLNNFLSKDNRIPPFGLSFDEATERNILPVPLDQYGDPGPNGIYNYWDEILLNPPDGANYGEIELLYQPISWEYVQFLYLINNGENIFLKDAGNDLLDSWLHTGMAKPFVMTSTIWGQIDMVSTTSTKSNQTIISSTTSQTITSSDSTSQQTGTFGFSNEIFYGIMLVIVLIIVAVSAFFIRKKKPL